MRLVLLLAWLTLLPTRVPFPVNSQRRDMAVFPRLWARTSRTGIRGAVHSRAPLPGQAKAGFSRNRPDFLEFTRDRAAELSPCPVCRRIRESPPRAGGRR